MKRLILSVLVICFCLVWVKADELPFAVSGYPTIWVWEEGSVNAEYPAFWHMNYYTREGEIFNLTNKIMGDSIVNGKKYGKMVFGCETKDDLLKGIGLYPWGLPYGKTEYADTLLYRQNGNQIFCIPKGEKEEVQILDFGLKAGDEFVDATGEQFHVENAEMLWENYTSDWIQMANTRIRCHYWLQAPKLVMLKSKDTGETDIWVEGIGSLAWGVVPTFIAEKTNPFRQLNQHPQKARVCVAEPENMNVMPNIYEDYYKAIQIVDWKYANDEEPNLEFSFIDDTLCVGGIQNTMSHSGLYYAECLIMGNCINFMIKQNSVNGAGKINFDVKIPGFKAGTYHIGTLELVCNGAKAETVTYPTIYSEHQQEAWDKLKSRGVTDDAVPTTNYWQVYCVDVDGKFTTLEYAATLRKTTMEGREYLKVGVGKTDTLLYRQEGNKVFMLQDGRELLLLDYALGVGETFTDPWGKRLTVKEAMECEPYYSYLRYFQQGVATFMSKEKPRILRLESEDGLYTDEWIEGIGSTQWGIVPLPVLQTLVACPIGTKWVHIDQASTLSMSAYLDTYEDSYKRAYFVPGYGITESFEQERGFHFVNDTLYVTDRAWLNTGVCYAECKVEGNTVDITTQMTMPETTGMGNHAFVVKFPGFKPGTYEISLNGQEPVTLACNGAQADYHPFIEVGKIWKSTITSIVPSEDVPNYRTTEETYTIGKDTLIQGRTCIGMERDRFQKRYFYEDGDKVYCYNTENERFYLIYDFGCQVGDRFTVVDAFSGTMRWWDENFFTCSVRDVDTVKTKDGMELRRITLEAEDVLGEHTTETWIEGIGSVYGPLHNVGATLYMGASMTLDSCTVSNHILYPFSTSTAIRAIDLTPLTRVETPIYDLSGRPVATPRRGIYIQGGRKVVKHWK